MLHADWPTEALPGLGYSHDSHVSMSNILLIFIYLTVNKSQEETWDHLGDLMTALCLNSGHAFHANLSLSYSDNGQFFPCSLWHILSFLHIFNLKEKEASSPVGQQDKVQILNLLSTSLVQLVHLPEV